MNQLAALVERSEFLAQPVHRLPGRERERRRPLSALPPPAERRKPRKATKMFVGRRAKYQCVAMQKTKAQRRGEDFEGRVARSEREAAVVILGNGARLGARLHEAVVGLGVRADTE